MADAKTDVKKDDPKAPSGPVVWEEVLLLLLGIVALIFVFIPRFFSTEDINNQNQVQSENISETIDLKKTYNNIFSDHDEIVRNERGEVIQVVKNPSLIEEGRSRLTDFFSTLSVIFFSSLIFLILFFWVIIYYANFRKELIIKSYSKKFAPEDKNLEESNKEILEKSEPDNNGIINPRWQLIGKYYNSANQSDWKLAILEADIMLYEVLDKSGFPGDSIGEMLRFTDKSKLTTLDLAWKAHKIRNEIAHQGMDYVLTRTKVEEAISNYEKVFEELNFI